MEDKRIIELYWERAEAALSETAKKYGKYCHYIAFAVLQNHEDSEECVNDTYLHAWNCMPPHRPNNLKTFIGKITRNLALNKYKALNAAKRGRGQMPLILDELRECLPSTENVEAVVEELAVVDALNQFLAGCSEEERKLFVRRYWYMCPIKEIAADYGMSESKVKMTLFRTRRKLEQHLQKEGIVI